MLFRIVVRDQSRVTPSTPSAGEDEILVSGDLTGPDAAASTPQIDEIIIVDGARYRVKTREFEYSDTLTNIILVTESMEPRPPAFMPFIAD